MSDHIISGDRALIAEIARLTAERDRLIDKATEDVAEIAKVLEREKRLRAVLDELERAAIAYRDCTDGSEREWLTEAAAEARRALDGPRPRPPRI